MIFRKQAFSPSYDLAPLPAPNFPSVNSNRRYAGRLRKRDIFLTRAGRGGGEAKSYDGEKAWSSINPYERAVPGPFIIESQEYLEWRNNKITILYIL
jgi:hypothetical protein